MLNTCISKTQGLSRFWVRSVWYHYHTVRTQNRLSPCDLNYKLYAYKEPCSSSFLNDYYRNVWTNNLLIFSRLVDSFLRDGIGAARLGPRAKSLIKTANNVHVYKYFEKKNLPIFFIYICMYIRIPKCLWVFEKKGIVHWPYTVLLTQGLR